MHVSTVRVVSIILFLTSVAFGQGTPIVSIAPVEQLTIREGKSFVGTIRAARTTQIGSAVDARLLEIMVREGDRVTKGQKLARLGSEQVELQIEHNKAMVQLRTAELEELTNGLRKEERLQAKAKRDAAKARTDWAKVRTDREISLQRTRSSSIDRLEDARFELEQSSQLLAEAEAAWRLAEEGTRKEKIAQARAQLQAQVEEGRRLQDQLEKHTIKSYFDGYVTAKLAEVGRWVSRGELVLEVAELDLIDLEVNVPEEYISEIRTKEPARVHVESLSVKMFEGTVDRIVPSANTKTRTFPVFVRIPNETIDKSVLLKSGMLARATLEVGKATSGILVPKDAIVLSVTSPHVYVFAPNPSKPGEGKVRRVNVELGIVKEGRVQVSGDLKPGDMVVTLGNERLRDQADAMLKKTSNVQGN